MHYIKAENRQQYTLANSLDDMISLDHPVRIIDMVIEKILQQSPEQFAHKGKQEVGRRSYSPGTLLKLYMYGYINGISSSRKLEVEANRNIEAKWLLGNLCPDHKTISDYRKNNGDKIRLLTLEFRKFLKQLGYIKGETIGLDGSKIKANANRNMITVENIVHRIQGCQKHLTEYLNRLQSNDIADDLCDEMEAIEGYDPFLVNKIVDLQKQIEQLKQQQIEMEQADIRHYSPTDPDARLMKTRDGKLPAYNMQTVVDAEHKMIVAAEVTNAPTDIEQLKPMLLCCEQQMDIVPQEALCDKGYYNPEQIKQVQSNEITTCFIPVAENNQRIKDKSNKITFSYDESKREYTCSEGKALVFKAGNVKKRNRIADLYQGVQCMYCTLKAQCTKAKEGRLLYRYHDNIWMNEYEVRMKNTTAKEKIQLRKQLVEHPFGTIKYWMGKIPLRLRSKLKVQTEIDLYTTAYNLKRFINIVIESGNFGISFA